jgi:hypothetical protein
MNVTTYDVVLWSVLSGPAVYLLAILFSPTPATTREFHYASRKLTPQEYVDTTLMYAFQVAAIALFATWGYLYGIAAVLVPVFWGIGYLIIGWLFHSGRLDDFIRSDNFGTLHQFIAQGGRYRHVGRFAALLTLFAIAGPAMFEAFFTASVVERAAKQSATVSASALAVLFLIFSAIYMLRGGYSGAVRLDRIQLATGYVGFVALLSILLMTLNGSPNSTPTNALTALAVICTIGVFVGRAIHARTVGQRDIFGLTCTGVAVLLSASPLVFSLSSSKPALSPSLSELFFPGSFSPLALFSLFVANGMYQLVDVGQWQRLLSLQPPSGDIQRARSIIRSSLRNLALTSPLTWIIAIVFGMTLKLLSADANAYDATYLLTDYIVSLPAPVGQIALACLLVSLVAVMFSTIDALVSATSLTITSDVFGRKPGDSPKIGFDRFITLCVLVLQLGFYLMLKELALDKTDAVLYLCWSFQIGFAPAVVAALWRVDVGQSRIILSLLAGTIGAWLPLVILGPDSVYEYSPWAALLLSSMVVVCSAAIEKKASLK